MVNDQAALPLTAALQPRRPPRHGADRWASLMTRSPRPGLPLLFSTDGIFAATGGQARVVADLLQRSENGLVCVLPAARMLLAGVDVVNNVLIARADKLRPGSLLQLGNRHTKVLAEPSGTANGNRSPNSRVKREDCLAVIIGRIHVGARPYQLPHVMVRVGVQSAATMRAVLPSLLASSLWQSPTTRQISMTCALARIELVEKQRV